MRRRVGAQAEEKMQLDQGHKFCVAPMMEWTDRHCRYFLRLISKHALLYPPGWSEAERASAWAPADAFLSLWGSAARNDRDSPPMSFVVNLIFKKEPCWVERDSLHKIVPIGI
jgi:tRNA-dihydrouridine synthase